MAPSVASPAAASSALAGSGTGGAAKEIAALIEDSVQRVDKGAALVGNTGNTMHHILKSVQDVDAIIATHSRDRKVAAWLQDTAKALAEI